MSQVVENACTTWSPVVGCSPAGAGCANCSAKGDTWRLSRNPNRRIAESRAGLVERAPSGGLRWTGKVRGLPEQLDAPFRWKTPRRIVVANQSDLFHDDVPDSFILRVWLTMARTPWHTYQVVTKRPERMRRWLSRWADTSGDIDPVMARGPAEVRAAHTSGRALMFAEVLEAMGEPPPGCAFPTYDWMEGPRWLPPVLPNVWLLVSIEDQPTADEFVPLLLATPAAVRGVCAEPLLGPLHLRRFLGNPLPRPWPFMVPVDGGVVPRGLDWVVVGGEGGPGARPCAEEWVRGVVRQCRRAHVPVYVKRLGAYAVSEGRTAPAELMAHPERLRAEDRAPNGEVWAWRAGFADRDGGDPAEWPDDLRAREFPTEVTDG